MGEWMMPIRKIAVLGAGTMGAQISVQIAKHGYEVSLHARHPERFQKTLGGWDGIHGRLKVPDRR
jgi:3-hydroxyacyl-CoA dehydrogenase